MRDYRGKTIIITGGASGIGLALAAMFGRDGANIVICDLDRDNIDAALDHLIEQGVRAEGRVCDVTQTDDLIALAEFAEVKFGEIDVLVNNAGIGSMPTSFLDTPIEIMRRIMETNLMAVINASQIFAARFVAQGGPKAIYNVGSENSLFSAVPKSYAYIASKHGVLAITELLAEEYHGRIEVKLICPGLVATGMTKGIPGSMPANRFAEIALEQLKAEDNFFVVSHAYNIQRIEDRHEKIRDAYNRYAPRYPGDESMDVRTLLGEMRAHREIE